MEKNNFAFDKTNFILVAAGMAVVVLGFILMSGAGSTEEMFNEEIFSIRRIKVAPVVCFFGFCFIVFGIMHKPKGLENVETSNSEEMSNNNKAE